MKSWLLNFLQLALYLVVWVPPSNHEETNCYGQDTSHQHLWQKISVIKVIRNSISRG